MCQNCNENMRALVAKAVGEAVISLKNKAKVVLINETNNGFFVDFDLNNEEKISQNDFSEIIKVTENVIKEQEIFSEIRSVAFKLETVSGAYEDGDENKKQYTRVGGVAFANKEELSKYESDKVSALERDHRKIGKEKNLFVFSEVVGKGLPLWTEKGAAIRRELEKFVVEEEIKRGYKHVITPDIANIELYKKSGHYPYYKDSMYSPIKVDDEEYMLRPMTCPHHFELYLSKPHSYRELPIRYAELAKLYRYEQSGELSGLVRVRNFCLSDAHIFCASPEQAGQEVEGALDLIEYAAGIFGLKFGEDYSYRLSLGDRENDKKYFKDDAAWEKSEGILRSILEKKGTKFIEAKDEAAFYGPKIDIQMRGVTGKEDTAFTVQYDFVMPKRFDLKYHDSDGQEKEVVVIHRSSIGAIERTIALLMERNMGVFPAWLAPVQITIIPIGEKHLDYSKEILKKLLEVGIRAELDESNDSFGKKVRAAKVEKVPFFAVIGDAEVSSQKISLESREGNKESVSVEELVLKMKKIISEKK